MTSHELAAKLLALPNTDVMILDGWNGGGVPRDINLGPVSQIITSSNADCAADCEDRVGQSVLVLGYGCY